MASPLQKMRGNYNDHCRSTAFAQDNELDKIMAQEKAKKNIIQQKCLNNLQEGFNIHEKMKQDDIQEKSHLRDARLQHEETVRLEQKIKLQEKVAMQQDLRNHYNNQLLERKIEDDMMHDEPKNFHYQRHRKTISNDIANGGYGTSNQVTTESNNDKSHVLGNAAKYYIGDNSTP